MLSIFKDHPQTVGETYLQHMLAATRFALRLLTAALACLVHALLPFLFTDRASSIVRTLHAEMVTARSRRARSSETPGAKRPRSHTP